MATELILHGRVQGVYCRYYCSQYGKKLNLRGSASNLPDGTVRVILDSEDQKLISNYISCLKNNPAGIQFYGRITEVITRHFSETSGGDYNF